jgi:bile acid-coenzyme A ligase
MQTPAARSGTVAIVRRVGVSYARRLTDLAMAGPDRPAVTSGPVSVTRAELESATNRLGRVLLDLGATEGSMVTIALPNSVDWFVAMAACWKIGAVPQPVSAELPARELAAIIELADPAVVVGVADGSWGDRPSLPRGYAAPHDIDDAPLPDVVSPAWKAPTSGGSTGRPKLIVSGDPSVFDETIGSVFARPDGCMVMPAPLFHNGPIVWACAALLQGSHVVALPRFDAEETLASVERYRADVIYLVPTMMKRIIRLPDDVRLRYDLSSLTTVWHLAEPCPPWLKQAWIDWLGPERILELYAGTEAQVATVISGTDWLQHQGSVGRPLNGEVQIADENGDELPPRAVGEVWLRRGRDAPTYRYIGAEARTRNGGWESLGDMGWVDEEGFLYLSDRMADMILVGGENVYPAEVEAAIQEHPGVHSCAVIGLPDEDLGNRIHAIVEASPDELDPDELLAFLADRLARYKLPRTIELVDAPLRNDAGKVRRSALRAARLPT